MVLPFCWPVGLKLSAPPKSLLALPTGAESHCPQDLITKRVGALLFLLPGRQLSPLRRNNKSGSYPPGSWILAEEGLLEGSERELGLVKSLECDAGSAGYSPCDLGQ